MRMSFNLVRIGLRMAFDLLFNKSVNALVWGHGFKQKPPILMIFGENPFGRQPAHA